MDDRNAPKRFLDAGEEPTRALTPLEGYEKKDLVSLEEAVKSIDVPIHNLDAMVWTAKRSSRNPPDGLTSDESASISLYTLEWPEGHDNLYKLLNQKLRAENRKCLLPWFSYLKLFLTALYKLPSTKKTVWRGIRGDVRTLYKEDFIWWGFSSCTTSIEAMERFIGQSGERTLFMIECINGKVIKAHSSYQDENEILLMPGTYLTVIGKWSPSVDVHIIHLQEENLPYELLKQPFNPSPLSVKAPCLDKLSISQSTLPKSAVSFASSVLQKISSLPHPQSNEVSLDTRRTSMSSSSVSSSWIRRYDCSAPSPPSTTSSRTLTPISETKINPGEMRAETTFKRSAKGPINIDECSPDGKYIQLANTSKNKDIDLTGWRLSRKVDNSPEIIYSLPSNFKLASGKYLKIHAKGQAKERPPYDLVLTTHDSWGIGVSVVTRLLNEQNEEKATHTQKTVYFN